MKSQAATSTDNHTLLVQLGDGVTNLSSQVSKHITEQQAENGRLHLRIDGVQGETRKGVDEIKASLANAGKISSSHVAVLLSIFAIGGGLAQSYISVRLGNITPLIERNAADNAADSAGREKTRNDLSDLRVKIAILEERSLRK